MRFSLRQAREVLDYAKRMWAEHLVLFTSGNISARVEDDPELVALTPTSLPYDNMTVEDIPIVRLDGTVVLGNRTPTSEAPMHLAIYRARPDVGAVVHTHSHGAMVLSMLRQPLPPVLTTLVGAVGGDVPVCSYTRSGTTDNEEEILAIFKTRAAVILPNHGLLTIGSNLLHAYAAAAAVEMAAMAYLQARTLGDPVVLPPEEVERIRNKTFVKRWPGTSH